MDKLLVVQLLMLLLLLLFLLLYIDEHERILESFKGGRTKCNYLKRVLIQWNELEEHIVEMSIAQYMYTFVCLYEVAI